MACEEAGPNHASRRASFAHLDLYKVPLKPLIDNSFISVCFLSLLKHIVNYSYI